MQKTLSIKTTMFVAVLALALGFAAQAFAYTGYDEISIEYDVKDSKTEVEVEYIIDEEEDDKVVKKDYTFFTTDLDEVWEKLAEELDITEEDVEDILDGEYGNDDDDDDVNRGDAEDAIDDAKIALEDAFYEIEDEDDEDEKADLQGHYDDAEDKIEEAEAAFSAGEYGEAEELAEDAEEDIKKYILGEDDDDEKEDAEDAIDDAEERIAKAEAYIEGLDEDDDNLEQLESYLEKAEEKLELAEEAYVEGDYEEAEEWAEAAEDKAKVILDAKDDDDDEDEEKVYVCHKDKNTLKIAKSSLDDHLDHGDTKGKCDDYDDHKKYRWDDKYKDFGKSSDREELQSQLRLLLTLLIELLRAEL